MIAIPTPPIPVFPPSLENEGRNGGAFDSSRKREKEISSPINRFRPYPPRTERFESKYNPPVDDGIGIIYKVRAGVFTVTSVQRATEAAVHAGFMRCLHSRKAANTAFRQQPPTSQPLHRVSKVKLLFVR